MSELFKKLNLKEQTEIVILNAPESFEAELAKIDGVAVLRELKAVKKVAFLMAFVTKQKEVDTLAKAIGRKAEGDAIVWFVYPKGTSKRYKCEFNRDNGWAALGEAGFETVRMVAIDEDWSAMRFRRAEFIKTMVRKSLPAISEAGKARLGKK
ncbi:MAG: hypothetical protein SF339_26835 [Blastocatellia bacterium]|nr:hypothetical protein [Blastocatellia bacterium]